MSGAMSGPCPKVADHLFGLFALHSELLGSGGVELREHLNAERSPGIFKQSRQQVNSPAVLSGGATVVGVNQDVGINELNAHATLPGSNESFPACPGRVRFGFGRGNGVSLFPIAHPAR